MGGRGRRVEKNVENSLYVKTCVFESMNGFTDNETHHISHIID